MRSMNGAASGSADNRGYPPGLSLPPGLVPSLGGAATGPTPGLPPASASLAGLGFGGGSGSVVGGPGAAGVSGAMGGSSGPAELKHHADFLSRLLAATPSYMSEIGNPPPGFFSDWLRRLVSKPSGNSGSSALHGSPAGAGLTFPGSGTGSSTGGNSSGSAALSSNNGNPSLGGASSLGQPETEGSIVGGRTGAQSSRDNVNSAASQLDAHIPSKRRKRSRLNDQLPLGVTMLFLLYRYTAHDCFSIHSFHMSSIHVKTYIQMEKLQKRICTTLLKGAKVLRKFPAFISCPTIYPTLLKALFFLLHIFTILCVHTNESIWFQLYKVCFW